MSGAGFVLALNFVVSGLLACAFMTIAFYSAKLTAARWFALAYALGMVYFAALFAIHLFDGGMAGAIITFAIVLAGMAIFNVGLAKKYSVAVPSRLIVISFVISLVACGVTEFMPRESIWRMLIYQSPYFVMQIIGAYILRSARPRGRLDAILLIVLTASAFQFLSKPFLMSISGGTGATEQEYLKTEYAIISQTLSAAFAIALALVVLVVIVRDILAAVTAESETDTLSGLLNRGGFERHATNAVEKSARLGIPITLIIADLDHFKSVNDTFGHDCGDFVIKAFAGLLKSSSGRRQFGARLGGEEFAIMLPGANLLAARLFAEGARSAFSALPINGLPHDKRLTASFGVAELTPSEGLSALMKRADEALYVAKKDGRDCVRVSLSPTSIPVKERRSG